MRLSSNTEEEKINEILSFFCEKKEDLISQDWNDGYSKEYEYAGLTFIIVEADKEAKTAKYGVLNDFLGEQIIVANFSSKDDSLIPIDPDFLDEDVVDKIEEAYDDFKVSRTIDLKNEKTENKKRNRNRNSLK